MIRSKAILRAAKGAPCFVEGPGCPGDTDTTVAAHANWRPFGKGMGLKADDLFVAFACGHCHRLIDEILPPDEARDYWMRGFARTLLHLVEKGIIEVRA